ncbi:hypothetical protein PVK06_001021 [Gossypium arboreum]|uniref:Uncharacterized protein n=1 Tax=Gossypium arboreum TaxID=29729 RepID=A0ABR0R135_GOSAR|nr:hypothetical protein PVK06_001021 [Gossypium arboreum]
MIEAASMLLLLLQPLLLLISGEILGFLWGGGREPILGKRKEGKKRDFGISGEGRTDLGKKFGILGNKTAPFWSRIPAFVILVAIWISAFNLDYMVLGEDSSALLPSPSLSGYPSYGAPPSPQSFSGYPSYGASPPPPPPSSISTYPSYRAPTPPSRPAQANCPPPPVPVQCCQYPYHPNPNEYYQPVDDHSPTPYSPLSTFSIVIFCCFILALSMR